MNTDKTYHDEESLDPQNWAFMRKLGHQILDDSMDYLEDLRNRPPWQHAPEEVKSNFEKGLPLDPQSPDDIYEEYLKYVLPFSLGNNHPRFWGWIAGTGTVMGAYAELLAAVSNSASGIFSFVSPNYVENQVLNWFKTMFGFPLEASGLITSGCSASNLIGLAVARNSKAGFELRKKGLRAADREMVLYASKEAHSSLQKAVELLGLGSESLRTIPVNDALEIDVDKLRKTIKRDRNQGCFPFCVIGAAGTTNTGAIDDLKALADICQEENLWYHVDGAFGAWAAIAPRSKHLVEGMDRADSLAFDLHKWMYLPYAIGGLIIKDEEIHRKSISLTPTYLAHGEGLRGLTGVDVPWNSDYSYQLSRSFPALKAWMTIKEHGVLKFGRLIQQNIDQAHYLSELVAAETELELALPVSLNIVCFRYVLEEMDERQHDKLNKHIEIELQEQGIAIPSTVIIKDRKYLHVAITNHRSRREDFDILVREVVRLGREFSKRIIER